MKELWVNVYEMFWRSRPSDKEQSVTFWDWSESWIRNWFSTFCHWEF